MFSRASAALALALSLLVLGRSEVAATPLAHGASGAADELVMFGIIVAGLAVLFLVNRSKK